MLRPFGDFPLGRDIGILLEAIDGIIDPAATLSQWAAIIVTRCTDSHRQSWGLGRHWKARSYASLIVTSEHCSWRWRDIFVYNVIGQMGSPSDMDLQFGLQLPSLRGSPPRESSVDRPSCSGYRISNFSGAQEACHICEH
jgi:hypothetical protein